MPYNHLLIVAFDNVYHLMERFNHYSYYLPTKLRDAVVEQFSPANSCPIGTAVVMYEDVLIA